MSQYGGFSGRLTRDGYSGQFVGDRGLLGHFGA